MARSNDAKPRRRRPRPERAQPSATGDPCLARATDLLLQLMAIPGPSGQERAVIDFIAERLRKAGLPASALATDHAHRRTPIDGEVGNLSLRLPGTFRGPRRLLMAHLDTVPLCVGARPVVRGDRIESADPMKGIGADDRAGVAVLLNTVLELLETQSAHPPLTFLWTIQEECGLHGARHARLGLLKNPKLAFNFDGGAPDKLTLGATGAVRLAIEVRGQASHAGGAPELGVSAIAIAARAIDDLQSNGWHGAIAKGRRRGTSNVGVIEGGMATNVVADRVTLQAEARSHSPAFRERIVREIEQAFQRAARSIVNLVGQTGDVTVQGRLDYESFRLARTEPCVQEAESAVRGAGGTPIHFVCDGGLDANWMTARGIPTVTLGCGQRFQHTSREQLDLTQFHQACGIAMRLATGRPKVVS